MLSNTIKCLLTNTAKKIIKQYNDVKPYVRWADMSKEVSFKNRDRFIQLGVAIASLRKLRGLSQEKLAEKAGVSRSLISAIEAPGLANGFSLEVFFDIADALEVDPADLINASVFPDQLLKKK